jgi:hypothetical protein
MYKILLPFLQQGSRFMAKSDTPPG